MKYDLTVYQSVVNDIREVFMCYYRRFYLMFSDPSIWNACVPNLSWTHFRCLLRVEDENAHLWYLREASDQSWSARVLGRNISTQYDLTCLPTKEQLKTEIERQKALFYLQHPQMHDAEGGDGA